MTRYACLLVTDGKLQPEVFSFRCLDEMEAFISGAEDPGEDYFASTHAYTLDQLADLYRHYPRLRAEAEQLLHDFCPLFE